MPDMIATAFRGVAANRRRLLTTAFAVLLGVAFTAGTLVLTDTLRASFDRMHADANAGVDAYVRRDASFAAGTTAAARDRVDATVVDLVASGEGVAAAAGRTRGYAQLVDAAGDLVGDVTTGIDTFGENWVAAPALNPWRLVEGTPPAGDRDVVVDLAASRTMGLTVGDGVTVLALGGVHPMTVSGIASFGDEPARFGAITVLFSDAVAGRLVGEEGRYDGIAVAAGAGVDAAALTERLSTLLSEELPPGHEVISGVQLSAEEQALTRSEWAFFDTFMQTFAVIALLVGGFIIFNTFSITVAGRTREFAMLRAIGAGRRQVMTAVLAESAVIGLVASAAGLVAGVGVSMGLRALLAGFGLDLPEGGLVVQPSSLAVALAVGVAITVLSALVPARRAARVAPVAAMRATSTEARSGSKVRVITGTAVTAAGALAMAAGLGGAGSEPIALVGLGALVVFFGVAALGPVLARPVSRTLGRPVARFRGVPGQLAQENAVRSPKRTAATAAALMIGVALVGFITIVASSVKASIDDMVAQGVRADFVVASGTYGFGGLDRSLGAELDTVDGVAAVSGLTWTPALVDGDVVDLVGVRTAVIDRLLDLDVAAGSLRGDAGEGLGTSGLAVTAAEAEARGWQVGTIVPVTLADGGERQLTVAAVVDDPAVELSIFADIALVELADRNPYDIQVFVALEDGVDRTALSGALASVVDGHPNAELQDREAFSRAQAAQVDPILGIIYALLAFATLIATLGIANTLTLSIFERTRELGVLRAVGMTRAQLRSSVRWESVLIATFGTFLGLAVAVGFGWSVVRALESEGIRTLVIPAGQLSVIAVLAAAAGVVAAVLPARRAARLDLLEALRS